MQIYKFNSVLKPVLWGGDRLVAFKRLPAQCEPIGESWELSAMPGRESVVAQGEDQGLTLTGLVRRYGADLVGRDVYRRYGDRFPLLIKLIDARCDLSVQVHPGDEMAMRCHGCMGKNEMWYILEAEAGAIIRTGFNRRLTQAEFDRRMADGTLLEAVNAVESRPGDTFYIPAGQIHTIGAGNLLVEIQQSSDVTYRVWDYNRRDADGNLRQLHVQQAREALDYEPRDGQVHYMDQGGGQMTGLVCSPDFDVCRLDVDGAYRLDMPEGHSFVAAVCLDGDLRLSADNMPGASMCRGETALIPAAASYVEMNGTARLLLASVPEQA